jgi:hypothetical protein
MSIYDQIPSKESIRVLSLEDFKNKVELPTDDFVQKYIVAEVGDKTVVISTVQLYSTHLKFRI